MAFIQMSVPLVFWGQRPPSHEITCICRTEDKKGVATGSRTGQICLWDILKERETERVKLRPRCLLFGGKSAIISLCFVKSYSGDRDRIVSLSEKGTVSLWDGKDGACLKLSNTKGKHTGLKSFPRVRQSETVIALYGQYSEVYVLDSNSLDVLCTLKASHYPNWIAQVCFLSNIEKKDALLAVSVDGVAKHWLLPSRNEMKEQEQIFEEKSRNLDISHPLSVSSYSHRGHCSALIVLRNAWQLYDATGGKMKLLLIHPCENNVKSWMRGEFIDYGKIIVWAKDDGRCFVYQLSPRCTPGLEGLETSLDDSSTSGCHIQHVLACKEPSTSLTVYLDRYWHIQGDKSGRLYLWDIRKIKDLTPIVLPSKSTDSSDGHSDDDVIPPDSTSCVADSWEPPAMPCGLTDMLYPPGSVPPIITCALYLSTFGRLVCGQADGSIAVLSATQAATVLMLQTRKFSRGWPQHCILKGHRGKVNALLYPHAYSKAYKTDYLVSGGSDFTVKLWDLYSGVLVHNFAVHGGEVKNIISCPPEVNPRLQTCVCSIAEDYSVAILSTSERKCLLVAACHSSPVDTVRWRLEEDFLLVHCIDGKLYVWQIETGSLDRCVDGETARTILSNTPEVTLAPTQSGSVPLQVRSVSVSSDDSSIQVLLFDPQNLINRLAKMEKLSVATPKTRQPTKQSDAFKTYLSARRNFGLGTGMSPGGGAGGRGRRRESMPAGSLTQTAVLSSSKVESMHPGMSVSREEERLREALGQAVAKTPSSENIKEEGPGTIVNIVRLLLSGLHAWNLDDHLDMQCEETLGLVRPFRPVSFGLISKGGCMSLVLPGWGLRAKQRLASHSLSGSGKGEHTQELTDGETNSPKEATYTIRIGAVGAVDQSQESSGNPGQPESVFITPNTKSIDVSLKKAGSSPRQGRSVTRQTSQTGSGFTFDQKYHVRWQLSRSLTTQHLLTMVSITNTLMNQSVGAHALASSSGVKKISSPYDEDSDSDGEDAQQIRDNLIRANWSQVAALHCVMLPERMEGKFRAPHLPVLASRFLDPCQAIREAAQALLQAELRRIGPDGRRALVQAWASKLQSQASLKSTDSGKNKHHHDDDDHLLFEGPVPTQQQQSTALIILGMIGAEFQEADKHHKTDTKKGVALPQNSEVMDQAIARQTAKTLQGVLLEKPSSKAPLHSNLRCSAAELLGRGFQLWEKYVDISLVVMGLLDIVIQYIPSHTSSGKSSQSDQSGDLRRTAHSSSRATKFASDVAQKALNLMIILRPVTMVTILAKEVTMYLGAQHVTHFPHSSLQQVQVGMTPPPSTAGIVTPSSQLLPLCKNEIMDLMKTVIEKCSQQMSLQLLEVVDVVLYCSDQDRLKKKSVLEIFPSFARIPNISYSPKSKRLAVGGRSGQVAVYDMKQGRTQMLNAHSHPVTALVFSDDGKMLATYAYADSLLSVWQISLSLFGINQAPKFVNSWPAISSSSPSAYSSYVRIEWSGSRTVVLHMPEGVECKYSLQ